MSFRGSNLQGKGHIFTGVGAKPCMRRRGKPCIDPGANAKTLQISGLMFPELHL
ncbi:hypothetical protein CBOM_04547 [Ceraceosorus bombacis]|uniref:Uncharacterized protein n=1 Tax=Ceraceosorus bombacis TaxID=401625 RepID=A0A0P1BQN0_9BASI|nr:hypothetical protein CBOM_04547 [Ceraceosorus bombacis]